MRSFFTRSFAFSLLGLAFFTFAFGFTYHAHAQNNSYTPLAPIPKLNVSSEDCVNKTAEELKNDPNCKTDVTTFIPAAIRFTVAIAGALAVVMIVIGGVQYASSDAIGGKSEGKARITNAIYGLILAIAAFVILETVNPATLQLNLDLGSSATSGGGGGASYCEETALRNADCTPKTPPTSTTWPVWNGSIPSPTHKEVEDIFKKLPVKITIWHDNCTYVGDTDCTSLDGLSQAAIGGLTRLSNRARGTGATIQINGGTEYWLHSETTMHVPGGGAVDLQSNSALDALIRREGKAGPATNNGCLSSSLGVYILDGATYVKEDAGHWHICYGS